MFLEMVHYKRFHYKVGLTFNQKFRVPINSTQFIKIIHKLRNICKIFIKVLYIIICNGTVRDKIL